MIKKTIEVDVIVKQKKIIEVYEIGELLEVTETKYRGNICVGDKILILRRWSDSSYGVEIFCTKENKWVLDSGYTYTDDIKVKSLGIIPQLCFLVKE